MLLKPVKDEVQKALTTKIYQAQAKGNTVREEIAKYVASTHQDFSAQLDLTNITQDIDKVVSSASQVASIDSAIAHYSELEKMLTPLLEKVDGLAHEIHLTGQPKTDRDELPIVKPIVPVQVARVALKYVLETPQDVDAYLGALRQTLLEKIQQNNRVRLE